MFLPSRKTVRPKAIRCDQQIHSFVGVNSFVEPCYIGYDVTSTSVAHAVEALKATLPPDDTNDAVIRKCADARERRIRTMNEAADITVCQKIVLCPMQLTYMTADCGDHENRNRLKNSLALRDSRYSLSSNVAQTRCGVDTSPSSLFPRADASYSSHCCE